MVLHSHDDGAVERRVSLAVPTPVEPVANGFAMDAGIGHTPHSLAQAASVRIRSGLSPATMSISAAVPNAAVNCGAIALTNWASSFSC